MKFEQHGEEEALVQWPFLDLQARTEVASGYGSSV